MDHNEASQSVPGLEEAEILEIIDHHRLADIQTTNPIYVRNEPVGSTNTIIAGMFQERGLIPSQKIAGIMAAAILSDTVMFKSPTCTQQDIRAAERMAEITPERPALMPAFRPAIALTPAERSVVLVRLELTALFTLEPTVLPVADML